MAIYKPIFIFIFLGVAIERIISTFRRKEKEGEVKYKWITYLLICTYLFCILVALFEFTREEYINYGVSVTGVFILSAGIVLRKASMKALGDFWSIHTKVFAEQPVIKTGPYKFLRHPYYTAVMLELIGISLFFNAFWALLVIFLVHFPLLFVRILLEEKVLIAFTGREGNRERP